MSACSRSWYRDVKPAALALASLYRSVGPAALALASLYAVSDPLRSEVLQGTLDLMVLKALDAIGPLHGYGIARRLEQISGDRLQLNECTLYTALMRLKQSGWIAAEWGASDNNRRARFYSITKAGRRQLARETESWEQIAGVIGRVLQLKPQK